MIKSVSSFARNAEEGNLVTQFAGHSVDIASTITLVRSLISDAQRSAIPLHEYRDISGYEQYSDAETVYSSVKSAYEHLLFLTEALGMADATKRISAKYQAASKQEHGLGRVEAGPFDYSNSSEAPHLTAYVDSIEAVFGLKTMQTVSKDLVSILRATQYAITDPGCFSMSPQNEADVHHRVEAVLRCVFPDLRSKPPISKPIKNFEPDTGLPSVKTLVEYKFVETKADVKRVADEILADTRGYVSADWNNFVSLIYETRRLTSETEWNNLLHDCGTAANTQAIVICGEATQRSVDATARTPMKSSRKKVPPRKLQSSKTGDSR